MTPHQLIKRIPKLSDDEAKQICKIILNHKFTIIDHAKKLLEKDYMQTSTLKENVEKR